MLVAGCAPVPDVIATDNDNGGQVQLRPVSSLLG
jgi:hypothetical protein